MAASVCLTCLWEEETGKTIDDSLSNVEWGRVIGVKEASVRRHRNHGEPKETAVPGVNGEETSFNSATGRKEFASIRSRPVTPEDAREWLRSSGDDPDEWHIAVRSLAYGDGKHSNKMSAWPKRGPGAIDTETYAWPVIQPAEPVTIQVAVPNSKPARDGLSLSLKCADPQIGFRAVDGGYETFHDERAMDLFAEVCRIEQPDSIVILGDFLDLPSQGRWAQEAGFARTTQMAIDAGHEWLATLRAVAPDARIILIEGNHDKRLQTYVETNALAAVGLKRANMPESWPVMSLQNLLRLEDIDVEYHDAYPTATYWDDDNTRNIHGTRANSKGSTTSQYSQELPHISTWVGHTHRAEITYKTVLGPRGEAIESYTANPGCLCKTDGTVPGVHGALHADGTSARVVEDWHSGFGSLLYGNGHAWPQVWRIKDGKAFYRDRIIAV